jgi:hypothetical protein
VLHYYLKRQFRQLREGQSMPAYKNLDGDSGIDSYESGPDFIAIHFKKGDYQTYRYTYAKPGAQYVDEMKRLADQGRGLNEYINRTPAVKNGYESKR